MLGLGHRAQGLGFGVQGRRDEVFGSSYAEIREFPEGVLT